MAKKGITVKQRKPPVSISYLSRNPVEVQHKLEHLYRDVRDYDSRDGIEAKKLITAEIKRLQIERLKYLYTVVDTLTIGKQTRALDEIEKLKVDLGKDAPAKSKPEAEKNPGN